MPDEATTKTAQTSAAPSLPSGGALWAMVVLLLASNLLASFTQSIMNVALDQIATEFHVRLSEANWVVLGYAIVTGTTITMAASLMKRFGIRKVMGFGYVAAFVGSILGFFAWNFPVMVVARLIQAATTGLYFPIVNEALLRLSPQGKAGMLLSVNSAIIGAGLAVAPPISGLVITCLGLRTLFLIPAAMALGLGIAAHFCLRDIFERVRRPIDIPSVIMSLLGLGLLMMGLNEITHVLVPASTAMVLGALVIGLFVRRQLKLKDPLLDLRPFKVKAFTTGELLIMFSYMSSVYLSLLAPLYLEGTAGYSSFETGCLLMGPILCYALLCFVSGRILGERGVWPLIPAGVAIVLAGFIAIAFAAAKMTVAPFLIFVAVGYGGIGLMYPATKSVDLEVLPEDISSNGSAIHSTLVQIAGSISSALFVGLMSSDVASLMAAGATKADAYAAGFSHTLLIDLGVLAAAMAVSLVYVHFVKHWNKEHAKKQPERTRRHVPKGHT